MSDIEIIVHQGERYEVDTCGECGVKMFVLQDVRNAQRRWGGFSFCPNGHQWGWNSGTERAEQEAVRRERDSLKQEQARLLDEIAAQKHVIMLAKQRKRRHDH